MTFEASDGVEITGALFGDGPIAIALAHMGRPTDNGTHWMPAARPLARRGYKVLVFNRRGVCLPDSDVCSGSQDYYDRHWKDVVGAIDYLRSEGARTVVVGGASLGAMASLHAATRPNVEVDGVVWFGGLLGGNVYEFTRKSVGRLDAPMLLVSTRNDAYNAVEALQPLKRWAGGSSRMVILPGSAHGTDVFSAGPRAARTELLKALFAYLKQLSE